MTPDLAASAVPRDKRRRRRLTHPLRFIGHYVRLRGWRFLSLITLVTLGACCGVGVQYAMKLLIDAMAHRPPAVGGVYLALGIFIALIALESTLWRMAGWIGMRATIRSGVDIRIDLFGHLAGHAIRYFNENPAGSLGQRITATAGAFGALSNRLAFDVTPPVINLVGALVIFAALDMPMTLALCAFVSVTTGALVLFGLLGRPLHRDYAREASAVGGELMDVIGNIWAVKSFSARMRERSRLEGAFSTEADAQRKSALHNEGLRAANDAALVLMAGGTLAWAVHIWQLGRITPGDVVLVSALTFRLLHGSRDLALSLIDVGQQYTYIEETLRLIGAPHGVLDPPAPRSPIARGGSIRFDHVTFGYQPERPVLRDVTLEIPAGQKVGLVGVSGAGKTTITHLVQRLYDVQSGRVLVDGDPVAAIRQDHLRDKVAVVPQDITLFHRSVMENIRFGRPEASDEEVFMAAKAAHCHEFICDLAEGYDTVVGDRGAKLSGGQRQRIGVARAFLKDSPILIFDEATSALDTASESAVQAAMRELMEGRTVLAVAHRLSTLVGLDRILVLKGGQVVEDGAFAELRAKGGLFAELWRMQADPTGAPAQLRP